MKKSKSENKDIQKDTEKDAEKDVWRKILIFLIIFFPYAIYLFLFKTKVSIYIKTGVVVLLGVLMFFIADVAIYPDRSYNELAFQEINNLKSSNKLSLGEVYYIDKKENFQYKGKEYMSFNIYDLNDMYFGVFEIVEHNKDYELVYLYRMDKKEGLVYDKKVFKEFESVHPVVMELILTDEQFVEFKEIKAVDTVKEDDLFFNSKTQVIDLLNEKITFKFNEFGVIEYKSESGNIENAEMENPLLKTDFKSVYTVISRNFQDSFEIVGYNYYNGAHAFNLEVGKNKYVVEYYYGEGASLQSIDDESAYMEFLKNIYTS